MSLFSDEHKCNIYSAGVTDYVVILYLDEKGVSQTENIEAVRFFDFNASVFKGVIYGFKFYSLLHQIKIDGEQIFLKDTICFNETRVTFHFSEHDNESISRRQIENEANKIPKLRERGRIAKAVIGYIIDDYKKIIVVGNGEEYYSIVVDVLLEFLLN
ncbi:MAG: hypothetical protein PF549_04920 [Patescibacteria group bacterium]|jgi:hypothetical protein|nr:hypothetical protein [Patescibacteria group bacterium]